MSESTETERAAVLRFLDPEDEALVEHVADALESQWGRDDEVRMARNVIAALRSLAEQKETP